MRTRWIVPVAGAGALVALALSASAAAGPIGDQPTPIARGPHISGVVHYAPTTPHSSGGGSTSSSGTSCSQAAGTNYVTNCKSVSTGGRPVNETAIASNSTLLVAGANDYNSYNGQGQDGFYWSAASNGASWTDAGPINVFPHNQNNGAGDPGLALAGTYVYYSSVFFNFYNCGVGGVELLYAPAPTGSSAPAWKYIQLQGNSSSMFEDKPALTVSKNTLYESWTHFGSCSGSGVTSPIQFEAFDISSNAPKASASGIQHVPGSTYSQGSALAPDGTGGFWIAWEEYPSATATTATIQVAHYTGSGFETLSNGLTYLPISSITDLPSPLPGFKFRTNSFPSIAVVSGTPEVVWTSYDAGKGVAYLWPGSGTASPVASPLSGGDQFFPSITSNGATVYVSFSEGSQAYTSVSSSNTYVQRLTTVGATPTTVSTAPSFPNKDAFFSGQFIGDYNGIAPSETGTSVRPVWTDLRGPDCCYSSQQMNAMVDAAG